MCNVLKVFNKFIIIISNHYHIIIETNNSWIKVDVPIVNISNKL